MTLSRACGSRVKGGIYLEIPLSRTGQPLWHFVFCPPRKIDLEANGLTAVGTKLVQDQDGTWHVMDVIGEEHYPNVADFLEETARQGISRRISKTTDFSRLTVGSCLFVIHARAWIENWEELYWAQPSLNAQGEMPKCPAKVHDTHQQLMCGRLWWSDVQGTVNGVRKMENFSYYGDPSPIDLTYSPAIFMGVPITRLTVIADGQDGHHEALDKASKANGIPVQVQED